VTILDVMIRLGLVSEFPTWCWVDYWAGYLGRGPQDTGPSGAD
jgi:hypothetical protein